MRFHKGRDAWGRGSYEIPDHAVVGGSDCGMWSDSPAPTDKVYDELEAFRAVLTEHGIKSRYQSTNSGNLCMIKRWVVVEPKDFEIAVDMADKYLAEHEKDTSYIHDAKG